MGKTLYELAREKQQECTDAIMLAKVNGKLTEITEKNIDGDNVEFVTTKTSIGNETYKRSVVLLMLNAFNKLKDKEDYGEICVEYSISKGLYCDLKGAVKNKADIFFVPVNNYNEAIKEKNENNYDIDIVKIYKFSDAIKYLESK